MRWMGLVVFVAVAACGPSITVPTQYVGKTKLKIVVAKSMPNNMCGFHMTADARPGEPDEWLTGVLPAGESIELRVKRREYRVTMQGCGSSYGGTTWGATLKLDVEGSTELVVIMEGQKRPRRASKYRNVVVAQAYVVNIEPTGGGGGGEETPSGGGEEESPAEESPSEQPAEEAPAEQRAEEPVRDNSKRCVPDGAMPPHGSNECCSLRSRSKPCSTGSFCGWQCCSGGDDCQ